MHLNVLYLTTLDSSSSDISFVSKLKKKNNKKMEENHFFNFVTPLLREKRRIKLRLNNKSCRELFKELRRTLELLIIFIYSKIFDFDFYEEGKNDLEETL